MKTKLLIATLLFGFLSFGQSIFNNTLTFTSFVPPSPYTAGQVVDPNITVSGIGRGSGINGVNTGNRYNANGWTTSTTLDSNDYFEFTLTPISGYQINFTNFVYFGQASGGAPIQSFRSSVDGFTSDIGSPQTTGATLSLSNAAYQNVTGSITFRFYCYGVVGPATTFSINDFTFNGTVTATCTSPTVQASLFSAIPVGSSTATVGWARGNGDAVLVVAKASSSVNFDPTSGVSYTANATFGLGSEIGTGNFVVYNGTGTSVNLTGLLSNTTYHFAFYEYNMLSSCYNPIQNVGNFTTTIPPSDIVLANNGAQVSIGIVSQATVNHVLHKFQVSASTTNATLNIVKVTMIGNYIASDVQNIRIIYSTDSVLDDLDDTLQTLVNPLEAGVKNLSFSQIIANGSTGYFFVVTEIKISAGIGRTIGVGAITTADLEFVSANKTGGTTAGGLQTIIASAPGVPIKFKKICTTDTTQTLSWSPSLTGSLNGYLLVVREGNTPHAINSIVASTTAENLNYALAPQFGSTAVLSRILYAGTATTVTVTGLTQGATYTFQLYAYKNNGASSIYSLTGTTTTQTINLLNVITPTSSPLNTAATLTWANPNVICYDQILVVATAAAGITFSPTGNGSAYIPNTVFSGFNQVVYVGSGNISNITGLTNGVTYYFEIFVRNGTLWSSGVEVSVIPLNIVPTILKTGDIAVIAYDNNVTVGNDGLRLLTLVDINPGTKFLWANATYETGGKPLANVRTDLWYECIPNATGNVPYLEFTYFGTSPIPVGSVFCIEIVSTGLTSTITAVSPSGALFPNTDFTIVCKSADGTSGLFHSLVNFSTAAPDAMFLLQGYFLYDSAGSTFEGAVLAGVQDGGNWYDLPDNLSLIFGNNMRRSRRHPQLLCSSIQENLLPAAFAVSYNVSNVSLTTGNRPYLLGSILNYGVNWSPTFGVCPTTSPFVVTTSDPFNRWIGAINTNWFDCNNWTLLSVPDDLTDVSIDLPVVNNPKISYLSPLADNFSAVAKCKNLTISANTLTIEGVASNPTGTPLNSRLEVNDNLTISGSGVLDMDDSNAATADGELSIIGNWTNNVGLNSFLEGNGTVKFNGSATQVINNNVHTNTEEFFNVILDNDFNTLTSNNLFARGNLEIKPNKNIVIASNEYIQASKNLKNEGSLLVNNSGTLYQSDDTGINTGSITVERTANIRTQDYVYWSSPVENFNISNVYLTSTPTSLIYKWAPQFTNPNGGEGYWLAASGENMVRGKGYIVRGPSGLGSTITPITARFNTGKPHNGVIPVTINRGNMTATTVGSTFIPPPGFTFSPNDDNWNLVGNPYPSAIDATAFLEYNAITAPQIEGSIRIWTHGTLPSTSINNPFYESFQYNYTANDYIVYNGTATVSGPSGFNGFIASGQAFFVLMNDGLFGSSTLTFNNAMRVKAINTNTQFYRSSNATTSNVDADKSRIWLDLINPAGSVDRIVVGYVPNATLEKDVLYDAFTRLDGNHKIFSLIGTEKMCIQGRPLPFNQNDQVPLGVTFPNANFYTIAISTVDGFFEENQDIYLEDKNLNLIHNLKLSPYNFTTIQGEFNDRFVLRYNTSSLGNDDFNFDNNIIVASQDHNLSIKSSLEAIKSVQVFDVLGRAILNKKAIGCNEIVFSNVAINQAVIVKIELENGTIVTRKVIL